MNIDCAEGVKRKAKPVKEGSCVLIWVTRTFDHVEYTDEGNTRRRF